MSDVAMSDFVQVALASDIPDPGKLLIELEDGLAVLFHVDGQFFCLDDVCTHDGGPLSDGQLADHTIACPRHGAKFDIRTGKALTMPATEPTQAYEVKVEDGKIFVRARERGWTPPTAPAPTAKTECCEGTNQKLEHHHASPGALPVTGECRIAASPAAGVISEDLVFEELKKVIDPELFVNIVDLGLIYNVDLALADEGKTNCKIDMTMTSPMCPAGPQMIANSKQVLAQVPGMGNVEVKIVLDPPWTPDKMTDAARDQLGIF
jgi:metal-sulfur cluster biosynthetic enzyme/nitrite reductase/ring-hydroxylating ferredoxin subunit